MDSNVYIFFNGTCEEAFNFYAQCFGAKIEALARYAQMPGNDPALVNWREKIMHGSIMVGDTAVMGSDAYPGRYEKPQGMRVTLTLDSPAEAERVFGAMSAGGTVTMPLQETFFAKRFGMLTDRFAIPWMIMSGTAS
jgi:PhnB protein